MLIAGFVRINVQPDARAPEKEGAREEQRQYHRAQNQNAREAEGPNQDVRETGGIAFRWLSDVHDNRRIRLLKKVEQFLAYCPISSRPT